MSLARFKEIYCDDWQIISDSLFLAIGNKENDKLKTLLQKYFSATDTKVLLNYPIASYGGGNSERKFNTPAAIAVQCKSRDALRAILSVTQNADARLDPDEGERSPTLLLLAVMAGDIETTRLLLENSARINEQVVSKEGRPLTALAFAVQGGFTGTANLLLDHGANPGFIEAALAIEARKESLLPILERLIELRPTLIEERDRTDNGTLLHHAVGHGNMTVVKYLIAQGADINACDGDDRTPLDYALGTNNPGIARYLEDIGATSSDPVQGDAATTKIEITGIVERLELLEEKFGIAISGLYATCEFKTWKTPHYYAIVINFDVASSTGAELDQSLSIRASAYNSAGQLLGTGSAYINKDDFLGFASMNITLDVDQAPEKIRLFPVT